MTDVRYEVDQLDRILVKLIAERQSYMDAAARIKNDRDAVRDPERIEEVVSKVLAEAERQGLSPSITMECSQHAIPVGTIQPIDNNNKKQQIEMK